MGLYKHSLDWGQMAEWLGNRGIDQKIAGSMPGSANTLWHLHPTCLGGMSLYLLSVALECLLNDKI